MDNHPRILIIDNAPNYLLDLREALKTQNPQFLLAADTESAWFELETCPPDLILLRVEAHRTTGGRWANG